MSNKGVNRVILVGHLGNDPETKFTQGGQAVCSFSVATSERWKDKSGDEKERTEWHRITVWGKLAEICGEYLKKGSQVYLEGKNQTEKWTDKDGSERYTTKVVCHEMQMLGGKQDGQRGESNRPARSEGRSPGGRAQQPAQEPTGDILDDDLPF